MPADRPGHQNSGRFAVRIKPATRPKRLATDLKCAASMPEGRGVRPGIARRIGQVLRTAPVRPPCTGEISKTETDGEDRDEENKHGIRPLAAPAIFSLPGYDNIMNLNAEKLGYLRKPVGSEAAAEPINTRSRAPSCAIRNSGKTPNHALWKDRAGQTDPSTAPATRC